MSLPRWNVTGPSPLRTPSASANVAFVVLAVNPSDVRKTTSPLTSNALCSGATLRVGAADLERSAAAIVDERLEASVFGAAVAVEHLGGELDPNIALRAFDLNDVAAPDLRNRFRIQPLDGSGRRRGLPAPNDEPERNGEGDGKEAEAETGVSLPARHSGSIRT